MKLGPGLTAPAKTAPIIPRKITKEFIYFSLKWMLLISANSIREIKFQYQAAEMQVAGSA